MKENIMKKMTGNESLERETHDNEKKIPQESWLISKWLMKMKIKVEFLLISKK